MVPARADFDPALIWVNPGQVSARPGQLPGGISAASAAAALEAHGKAGN